MTDTTNRASSRNFDVELCAIAEDVEVEVEESPFGWGEDHRTTIFFLEVENTGTDRTTWWADEHAFLDGEGYQYGVGEYDLGVGDFSSTPASPSFVPDHWYSTIDLLPGARARCVTGVDDLLSGVSLDRLVYECGADSYELQVNRSTLADPPAKFD